MDFGVVSFDGLVGSDSGNNNNTSGFGSILTSVTCSDPETKHKLYGSEFLKQQRSVTSTVTSPPPPPLVDDYWKSSKLAKTCTSETTPDSFSSSFLFQTRNHNNNTSLKHNNNSSSFLFSDGQNQHHNNSPMLSFSCPINKSDAQNASFPYFHLSSTAYNRTTSGYSPGSYNGGSVHGVYAETKGLFTEQQWLELQHQALIYKYITANVPIPSNLLIPIRKALESAGFSTFSGGLLRPNTLAWGPFHLGFSGNTDPEPGRCRRTDGKKWRCSRDAVADQKYCERHMNRGRHRSRKPVEGQSGHSAAATKPMPTTTTSSSLAAASVVGSRGSGGTSSSLTIAQQHYKSLQTTGSSNLSAATSLGRMFLDKDCVNERMHDPMSLSMLSPKIDMKAKETGFGFVSSDSLVNPSQSSSLVSCRTFGSSQELTGHDNVSQHSLRQFMDDWPKSKSARAGGSWPDLDHVQSDRTQLSISIPMAPADFMSSTSSPNHDKANLSPLRLSHELDPIQMGLGVGNVLNESSQRQANWIPISWESSMGGPLGEVLHNTANNGNAESKSSSGLNLMTEGWDSSPRLNSSPTGVLQKTTFGSLSNSSAGSSPRADNNNNNNNKATEGVSLCKDLAGSSVVQSASLPAL